MGQVPPVLGLAGAVIAMLARAVRRKIGNENSEGNEEVPDHER